MLSTHSPVFKLSSGTTARVYLINLRIEGKILVEGGFLELINSTLDGQHDASQTVAGDQGAIGLDVQDNGHATLKSSHLTSFSGGGASVSGGATLEIESSVIKDNGRSSAARFGGVQVTGGMAVITSTLIENNGFVNSDCASDQCVRGGGIRLVPGAASFGRVELKSGTQLQGNMAYEGRSIYIHRDVAESWKDRACTNPNVRPSKQPVTYELPAPPAHYVVIMGKGLTTAEISKGLIDENYPFECAPGKYGADVSRDVQATPRCSGPCPEGFSCPVATVEPQICARSTYCPEGSATETSCPAGTFGAQQGQSNIAQCQTCKAGTECPIGSAEQKPCAPGSYAKINGSAVCTPCGAGSYQDESEQLSCKTCIPGHACPSGSASPKPCPAGFYASDFGLNETIQCTVRQLASLTIRP